jgi:hypothetical protein
MANHVCAVLVFVAVGVAVQVGCMVRQLDRGLAEQGRLSALAWWRLRKWKRAESHCREMAAQIYQQREELRLWQLHAKAISHRERPYLEWLRKKQKRGRRG